MWWRRSWFSLNGTIGIQGQERGRSPTPLSSSAPANRSVHHADLSVLSHGRILSARGRLITGSFDGSHGAHLVVVRGVAADADGAEEGSVHGPDQHAARHGHDPVGSAGGWARAATRRHGGDKVKPTRWKRLSQSWFS